MQTTKTGVDLELPENLEARKVAIKNVYPVEILCPHCFLPVFFYRSSPIRGRQLVPGEALTIEGKQPVRTHPLVECPQCTIEVQSHHLTWRGKSW